MTDMDALKNAGAVGFTDDGIPILSQELVRKAMEKALQLQYLRWHSVTNWVLQSILQFQQIHYLLQDLEIL